MKIFSNVGLYSLLISLLSLGGFQSPFNRTEYNPPTRLAFTYTFLAGSKVATNGKTNVKPFSCIYLYNQMSPVSEALLSSDTGSFKVDFKNTFLIIASKSLECGNKGMNRDLARSLKADIYPNISLRIVEALPLAGVTIDLSRESKFKVNASLTVAGVTKSISIITTGKYLGNGVYHFSGFYSLDMTDFNVEPPTALFGIIKVRKDLEIQFDMKVRVNATVQKA